MGLFDPKKIFTEKEMRWKNVKYSKQGGAMKKVLANPAVVKMLDRWDEQHEFYALLQSKAKGGVTKQEMRQILGQLRRGGGKTIDRTEAMNIAHAMFPGRFTDRYDFSPEERVQGTVSSQSLGSSSVGATSVPRFSGTPSRHASVGRRSSSTASSTVAPTAEYRRRPGQHSPVPRVTLAPPRISKPMSNFFSTHFGSFRVKSMLLIVFAILATIAGLWWFGVRNSMNRLGDNDSVASTTLEGTSSESIPELSGARYVEYSPGILASDGLNDRRVLFFYASWCPFCRPADAEFRERMNEIPSDVTVIRVNYNDSDTDEDEKNIARQYGVTYQHTFVQIDRDGKAIAIWNGGKLKELLSRIK